MRGVVVATGAKVHLNRVGWRSGGGFGKNGAQFFLTVFRNFSKYPEGPLPLAATNELAGLARRRKRPKYPGKPFPLAATKERGLARR